MEGEGRPPASVSQRVEPPGAAVPDLSQRVEPPAAATRGPGFGIERTQHLANGLFLGLAAAQLLDAHWSGDPAKQQVARINAGFLTGAAIVPWVGRFLAQGLTMNAGFSALKAGAVAGAVGNGLSASIGALFTGISAVEAYQAWRDLSQGKQGAGYALATSLLDTGAGTSATAMAVLATIGKAARPSLSLAAGGLTILSLATRLCPMAYSIAQKTGVLTADQQPTGLETGRSVASQNLTPAAATVVV